MADVNGRVAQHRGDDERLPSVDDRPTRAQQYQTAVEEYRFQTTFNWSRTQYLLAFNAAILAAGVGLAGGTGAKMSVVVFAFGIVVAFVTWRVQRVQHSYYRRTRDRMRRLAGELGIESFDTTATMAGVDRWLSVQSLIFLLLCGVAAANVAAGIIVLA